MIENLIPAVLTLGGAGVATKLFVASVRDPRRRGDDLPTTPAATQPPKTGAR